MRAASRNQLTAKKIKTERRKQRTRRTLISCPRRPLCPSVFSYCASGETLLVQFFGIALAADALVDGLASGEAFLRAVPVRDFFLAGLPAQQYDFAIDLAGKIEQADIEVLHLHAGGGDLGHGVARALRRLLALGLAPQHLYDVHFQPAGQEDA